MAREPILDIAHLGHIGLLTPKFEASREFFIDARRRMTGETNGLARL